jgi:hypothetical protein
MRQRFESTRSYKLFGATYKINTCKTSDYIRVHLQAELISSIQSKKINHCRRSYFTCVIWRRRKNSSRC